MKNKYSKTEAKKEINDFFEKIKEKSPKAIKKIKNLAMRSNTSLKEKKKLFCRHCLSPYSGKEIIRIKKGIKSIECKNCDKKTRWKIR